MQLQLSEKLMTFCGFGIPCAVWVRPRGREFLDVCSRTSRNDVAQGLMVLRKVESFPRLLTSPKSHDKLIQANMVL